MDCGVKTTMTKWASESKEYWVRKPHGPFETAQNKVWVPTQGIRLFHQRVEMGEIIKAFRTHSVGIWIVEKWPMTSIWRDRDSLKDSIFRLHFRKPDEEEMAFIRLRELTDE